MARWLLPLVVLALLPASASAAALAGTKWRVARVGDRPVAKSFHARLDFTTARAKGYDGCNWFSADYRASGARLRFSGLVSTAVGCDAPPSVMGPVYHARGYRITGRKLELLGRRGRTLAVLRRR